MICVGGGGNSCGELSPKKNTERVEAPEDLPRRRLRGLSFLWSPFGAHHPGDVGHLRAAAGPTGRGDGFYGSGNQIAAGGRASGVGAI